MRKIGVLILTLLVAGITATAQPSHEKREHIKALQVAYFTDKLDLTAKQAEKFWPVYNAFEGDRMKLRKSFGEKYMKDNPSSSHMDAREAVMANIEYKEQELALLKKYKDELLKTISEEQLAELYKAEAGFKQMLIKELGKRGDGPPHHRPPMRR